MAARWLIPAFDLHASLEYFDEDAVLISVDARDDEPTKVDVRKRFLRVFDAERDFVQHVWTVIEPLLDSTLPVVVLFDIDQTLGSRKGRAEESALVRPAAAPLMEQLRVRMGIPTTRGITDLRANLDDALHLRGIAPYIDPDHITAAEMSEHADVTVTTTSAEVEPEIFERVPVIARATVRRPRGVPRVPRRPRAASILPPRARTLLTRWAINQLVQSAAGPYVRPAAGRESR